jgi:hypothetical protein
MRMIDMRIILSGGGRESKGGAGAKEDARTRSYVSIAFSASPWKFSSCRPSGISRKNLHGVLRGGKDDVGGSQDDR